MTHLETHIPSLRRPVRELPDDVLEHEPNLPPIKIMYCDNDLFRNHMAEVKQHLESVGRRVEVTVFQNETDIKEHFTNNQARTQLLGGDLFLDLTTGAILNGLAQDNDESTHDYHSLDSFFNTVYTRATLGEEKWPQYQAAIEKSTNKMEAAQTVFQTIIERIVETGQTPDKVTVVLEDIFEHGPFSADPEAKVYGRKRGMEMLASSDDSRKFLDNYAPFQPSTELQKNITELLTTWLTDAGINPATIEVLATMPTDSMSSLDEPNHWVISDRHVKRHHNTVHFEQAKWLQLPIASFFASAVENKLLPPPENLSDLMEQALEHTFAPSAQPELYH